MPLIFGVIGGLLVAVCGKRTAVKAAGGVVFLILMLVFLVAYEGMDDIYEKIPFAEIDGDGVIDIGNSGTMYLDSSVSFLLQNTYMLPGGDDLEDWLRKTGSAVYICVKDGGDVTWSKSLGMYRHGMEDSIREIYEEWIDSGQVATDKVVYKFLFFSLIL